MEIVITQQHIDEGDANSQFFCPIALALKEKFPDDTSIIITYDVFRLNNKWYHCAKDMTEFQHLLKDSNQAMPFSFNIKNCQRW